MDKTLKVAAAQIDCLWENVTENLRKVCDAVHNSSADLVVFPEMFATGFSMSPEKIAQPSDGTIVSSMRSLATQSGKALIFSAAISENDNFYNRLFFIFPDGELKTYDKRHLFRMAGEQNHYAAGDDRLIVEYKGFRICPLVCYDLRFPVFSRRTTAGNYDLLIYIASWGAARSYAWTTLLRARAIENQTYCIGVNRVGDDPKEGYSGDSVVLDFFGRPLVEAKSGCEQVVEAELSLEKLEKFRTSFPAAADADNFAIR